MFMEEKINVSSCINQTNIKRNFFAALDNVLGGGHSSISDQIAVNMNMIQSTKNCISQQFIRGNQLAKEIKSFQQLPSRLTPNLNMLLISDKKQTMEDCELEISPSIFKSQKLCGFNEDNNTTMLSSINNTMIGSGALDNSIFSNQTTLFNQ